MPRTSSAHPYEGPTSLADPVLLDRIDQLFTHNVSQHLDLPQLVVEGDQISGKSSVLEGLIGLPLPRDSGLCIEFACHITFRRGLQEGLTASIIPSKLARGEHRRELAEWKAMDADGLTKESFTQILKDLAHPMHDLRDVGVKPVLPGKRGDGHREGGHLLQRRIEA